MKILLVEDHLDSAEALRRLLSRRGHSVTTAHTRAAALQIAGTEPFDFFLIDIGLPDGDGCELLRTLSADAPVKAIALTGHAEADDIRRGREAGFSDYLVKPVSLDAIEACLNSFAIDGASK